MVYSLGNTQVNNGCSMAEYWVQTAICNLVGSGEKIYGEQIQGKIKKRAFYPV